MNHTIKISLHGDTWHAEFSDPTVILLMGTTLIPTPYLAGTPKEVVIKQVQKLNPEYAVS